MTDLNKAKELLLGGGYTCVLYKDGNAKISNERGVNPLVSLLQTEEDFSGYSSADKVVGKATAFLYALLNVKAVYACVISKPAFKVLSEHGIFVEYGMLTEYIVNRKGDGVCPFEEAVMDVKTPKQAQTVILKKLNEMSVEASATN